MRDNKLALIGSWSQIFTLAAIDELTPSRDLSAFVTLTGKMLSPQAMRGLYLVHEPA